MTRKQQASDDEDGNGNDNSNEFVLDSSDETNCLDCAICLIYYETGDTIAFSHNPKCQHHFHRLCITEWLKYHDECPCCRSNYLTFEDDNQRAHVDDGERSSSSHQEREERDDPSNQLDHTGRSETEQPPEGTGTSRVLVRRDDEEPWEVRLDRTVDRLRQQVEDRVLMARRHLRDHRENHRRQNDDGQERGVGVERSIELVRSQLSRLRQEIANRRTAASNREQEQDSTRDARWEDAIQVVRTRVQDIANSESANRLRERSTQTMQSIIRHASQRMPHSGTGT